LYTYIHIYLWVAMREATRRTRREWENCVKRIKIAFEDVDCEFEVQWFSRLKTVLSTPPLKMRKISLSLLGLRRYLLYETASVV
jgi:hypothetical protein